MIRDARPIDDASIPSRIVGFRGFIGSLLIHLMLLVAILSYDAYLSSPHASKAGLTDVAGGAAAAGDPIAGSAAAVRAGQFGAEPGQPLDVAEPPTDGEAASWPRRIADRLSFTLALGTLTDHLLQSTVFVLAASLLTLAFRRHGARVRYWIWFGASLKFLVPFTPIVALGSQLDWPATFKSFARHPIVAGIGEPLINANEGLAMMVPMWPVPPSAASAASAAPALGWIGLSLLIIWASGFAAIVSMRVRAWRQVRALLAASTPMQLPDVDIPGDVALRSVSSA